MELKPVQPLRPLRPIAPAQWWHQGIGFHQAPSETEEKLRCLSSELATAQGALDLASELLAASRAREEALAVKLAAAQARVAELSPDDTAVAAEPSAAASQDEAAGRACCISTMTGLKLWVSIPAAMIVLSALRFCNKFMRGGLRASRGVRSLAGSLAYQK